jgi:hypothetical protein
VRTDDALVELPIRALRREAGEQGRLSMARAVSRDDNLSLSGSLLAAARSST